MHLNEICIPIAPGYYLSRHNNHSNQCLADCQRSLKERELNLVLQFHLLILDKAENIGIIDTDSNFKKVLIQCVLKRYLYLQT